ncbi:MAG: hypothetical protein H5U07_06840 [Candidatus Aminicenantes bacterium]|nr:hypothetical protein [Candidatus Aminicenantes bacterium]
MIKLQEKTIIIKGKKFFIRVEDSDQASDYQKYENLRQAIWQFEEDHLAGCRNLLCENFLHEGSSLFIGAFEENEAGTFIFDEAHLVGFSYGFVGIRDKSQGFDCPDNLWFYSQFLGVRADRLHYGLGILIKEFQKEILLNYFHVKQVVCTYDPLTAVNAYRNLHRLGMEVLEYRIAPYGEYGGRLNRADVPCDRFFAVWYLEKAPKVRQTEEYSGDYLSLPRALRVRYQKVTGRTGPLEIEVVEEVNTDLQADQLLVQIPADFYLLLNETDVPDEEVRKIPINWRLSTRQVFLMYFQRGYQVVDFLKVSGKKPECFYLLKKESS